MNKKKRIYICSPGASQTLGQAQQHVMLAQAMLLKAIEEGHTPISPILMSAGSRPEVLVNEEPEVRARMLQYGMELLRGCDEMWLIGAVGNSVSGGMIAEMRYASKNKMPTTGFLADEVNAWAEEFGLVKPSKATKWDGKTSQVRRDGNMVFWRGDITADEYLEATKEDE